jgi:hypothetical protein
VRFDPTYRVMVYSESAFQIGDITLTRDDVARLVGWMSPQVLRNTVRFCNAHGISSLKELAAFTPGEIEQEDKIGRRTVYGVARILNSLAPNALRGAKAEWKIENAAPLTREEEEARAKRAEQARTSRARHVSRRGQSQRFAGSVRSASGRG